MLPALVSSVEAARRVLPPGVHWATIEEIEQRFATNDHRKAMFEKIVTVMAELRSARCAKIYIAGGFVTDQDTPGDFKIAWEPQHVQASKLHPSLLSGQGAARARYGGDIFIAMSTHCCGEAVLEALQIDSATGERKGILGVVLTSGIH